MDYELYHHGVKGMKWGVRRKRIVSDKSRGRPGTWGYGSKTERQKEWEDMNGFNPNRPNKTSTSVRKKNKSTAKKIGSKIGLGTKATSKVLAGVGKLYLADQVFNGGRGTQFVKAGAKAVKNAAMDRMFNAAIIDATGKVIYRYNM